VFRLLDEARRLSEATGGAFDITIAPLVRCWGFMGGAGALPFPDAIAEARARIGMHLVELDAGEFTVRFAREGMMLDLGAIGKGYAIERATTILREDGITSAILHGGTSTVSAIGHPPGAETWRIAIERPPESRTGFQPVPENPVEFPGASPAPDSEAQPSTHRDKLEACPALIAVVPLKDESLSVSAVWGRCFQSGDKTFGHVIDPRTGEPANAALLSAVVLPSATETDALSTALLTLGSPGLRQITHLRPNTRCLVVSRPGEELKIEAVGIG
jgi:thiamine biosynthesis lipoprotein